MFHTDSIRVDENDHSALEAIFEDRVKLIMNLVLENVNTNTISKKNLMQLMVGNIMRNEQDEIKQIISEHLVGRQPNDK